MDFITRQLKKHLLFNATYFLLNQTSLSECKGF